MIREMMRGFRRTTLITIFCLSVLGGIGLSRRFSADYTAALALLLPLVFLIRRRSIASVAAIIVIGAGIGLWRGGVIMQKAQVSAAFSGQKVLLEVTALNDAVYGYNSQIEFNAGGIEMVEPQPKQIAGNVKISGFGVPMVFRGDRVRAEGKIYPSRGSNQLRVSYAKLAVVGQDSSLINSFTRKFAAGLRSALPEPASSLGLGILIGQRSSLPKDVIQQLTIVGLVHIVAVSGYNVTILSRAVARLKLGSKYQRLVMSLALIGTFVLITGFSASIVRAAIVAGLSLVAWYYGRRINAITLITFTAALTGFIRPFYVWSDLGWYLSFLAFFGVLAVAPLICARLFNSPPRVLVMILIETLCAEIMTLPLIMMAFNQLSLVGLAANLLVVPLVPVAMLLSAIAGIAGFLLPELAGWFSWPAGLLLTYIIDLVRLLSSVPYASVRAAITPAFMLGLYAAAGIFILFFQRKVIRLKAAGKGQVKNWLGV